MGVVKRIIKLAKTGLNCADFREAMPLPLSQ